MNLLEELREAIDGAHWQRAVALLEASGPALYWSHHESELAVELDRLPGELVRQSPLLPYQVVLVGGRRPLPELALPQDQDALRALGRGAGARTVLQQVTLAMMAARQSQDQATARTLLERGDVVAAEAAGDVGPGVDPVPWWHLEAGITEYVVYDRAAAQHRWELAFGDRHRDPQGLVGVAAAGRLALMFSMIGDMRQALVWRERALAEGDPTTLAGRRALGPAMTSRMVDACERLDGGEAIAALPALPSALDRREEMWPQVLVTQCLYGIVFGDPRTALELLDEVKRTRMAGHGPTTMVYQVVAASEVALALALGDVVRAEETLDAAGNGPHLNLLRARLVLLTGDLVGTVDLATIALANPRATITERGALSVLLMAAEHQRGDRERAVLHAQEGSRSATRQGSLRSFLSVDRTVIDDLARDVPFLGEVGRVLDASSLEARYPTRVTETIRLTRREQVVLEQIASGKTLTLIARELVVSENTVRSQRRSLYRKLGATDRRRAVSIARARGLLNGVKTGEVPIQRQG